MIDEGGGGAFGGPKSEFAIRGQCRQLACMVVGESRDRRRRGEAEEVTEGGERGKVHGRWRA